jgi:hypothetical protein
VLGQGRDPLAPLQDVINDEGDIVVPVDGCSMPARYAAASPKRRRAIYARRLDPFIRKGSPLSEPVTKPKATWVEPVVEAEVAYSTVTETTCCARPCSRACARIGNSAALG